MKPKPDAPDALNAIVDVVLAYKPKAKTKPAKKRTKRAAKIAKEKAPTIGLRQQS
jgi:hypothetical protein